MRFLAAQVDALLDGDLWLTTARHANAMAVRLAAALDGLAGVRLAYPVESNGVFTELGLDHAARLQQDWSFEVWSQSADGTCIARWMTAFDTSEADVDALAASIISAAGGAAESGNVSRETESV
jgi:threonine aldolase